MAENVLLLENVEKVYRAGSAPVTALRGVSLTVKRGDHVAIMGPSGCGKSTLLHIAGAMDRADAGRVILEGKDLSRLPDAELARTRRRRLGFVFQFFNLLPTLTVSENVALPLLLDRVARREAEKRARELLERVGLEERASRYPRELSGGEMQRVAVARALAMRPLLVLADEPTGSLDTESGERVLALLAELNRELGVALVIATHADEVAVRSSRRILLRDGRVERLARS